MNNTFIGNLPHGVDISHHNGNVDHADLKQSGVSFVISKVCDGAGGADGQYSANDAKARAAGLISSGYLFVHPYMDATAQTDKFLSLYQPHELPPFFDLEWDLWKGIDMWTGLHNGARALSPHLATAQARADFLGVMIQNVIDKLGVSPGIYTSASFFDPTFGMNPQPANGAVISDCPLWVVDVNPGRLNPKLPGAWNGKGWMLRQCGIGRVGKCSPVDLDVFNGTEDELAALNAPDAPQAISA